MTREIFGEIELVPGVVGPERVVDDRWSLPYQGTEVQVEVEIEYDRERRRYVCRKFSARTAGEITGDMLRMVPMSTYIKSSVLIGEPVDGALLSGVRELPNPDGREPWGLSTPEDIADAPTRRALQWVAHWYKYAFALNIPPTETVAEQMKLPRSTAGRWITKAREHNYLGKAEKGKRTI